MKGSKSFFFEKKKQKTFITFSRGCGRRAPRLMAGLLVAYVHSTPARAASQHFPSYDPALCAEDAKGKRYIAVGLTVLGIPADPAFMASATELPADKRLTPPNPADQPGCPDNPQQVSIGMGTPAYVLPNFGDVLRSLGLRGRQFGFGSMYGFGLDALGPHPPIQDLPLDFRIGSDVPDLICKQPGVAVTEQDAVKTCRWHPQSPEPATAYIVDPQRYSTPSGDPFGAYCPPGAAINDMLPCEVGPYATSLGLTIGYSFLPATSIRAPDMIDRIISFDRQVRAALAKAVIPDYPWQNLSDPHALQK